MAKPSYWITNRYIDHDGVTLHQIEREDPDTGKIEIGGWVQDETNLDENSAAWIANDAKVYDGAFVTGKALISGQATVYGHGTIVDGDARVHDNAKVFNGAHITERASVCDDAIVSGATVRGDDCVDGDKKRVSIKFN